MLPQLTQLSSPKTASPFCRRFHLTKSELGFLNSASLGTGGALGGIGADSAAGLGLTGGTRRTGPAEAVGSRLTADGLEHDDSAHDEPGEHSTRLMNGPHHTLGKPTPFCGPHALILAFRSQ
jgi:hypothetical protein